MADRALSLAALTVLEAPPLEAVRIAARCGYSHIGLRPVKATEHEPHVPILADGQHRRELLRAVQGEGLGVLDVEILRVLPQMDWDLVDRVLAFAQEFGATRLLVADNDPDHARSRDTFAALAERSAPFGVKPHLEFMPWTAAPNLAAARERIGGMANAAILIDAFHLARSGGTPADVVQADPQVGYLQLCDIAGPIPDMDAILAEARGNRLFPGEGDLDLAALLRRLPGLPISLEVPADRLRDSGIDAAARAQLAFDCTRRLLEGQGAAG
jgi:sugar phosphate isomerase/epimerase